MTCLQIEDGNGESPPLITALRFGSLNEAEWSVASCSACGKIGSTHRELDAVDHLAAGLDQRQQVPPRQSQQLRV
jgi:hypothetical protein